MTEIKIIRGPEPFRGNTYSGRSAGSIGRRLFGRAAEAVPSPDPANRGQGMITRTDRYGTHMLADYIECR